MAQAHMPLGLFAFAILIVVGKQIKPIAPHQRHLAGVVILGVLARLQAHRPMPAIVDRNHHGMIALAAQE